MEPIQTSEKKSLKQTLIEEIKHYIIDGNLKAGDKLPTERAFTEKFGVSRSVVREALSYLENVGIVRIRQGQGAFLNESNIEQLLNSFLFLWQVNHANVREMLGLRVIFECSAVDEIIRQDDYKAIAQLEKLVKDTEQIKDVAAWRQADIDFHRLLLQATHNDLFLQMTDMITSYFFQVQHIELTKDEYHRLNKEHQNIVISLKNGDAMQAKAVLTQHINQAKA